MISKTFLYLLGIAMSEVALSQMAPLDNRRVISMTQAGVDDDSLIKVIRSRPAVFDTSPEGLRSLLEAGVRRRVLAAMLSPDGQQPAASARPSFAGEEARSPMNSGAALTPSATPSRPSIRVEAVSSQGSIDSASDTVVEAMKTLHRNGFRIVTHEDSDFVLQITRLRGKKFYRKDVKFVLTDRDGNVVFANTSRSIGGAADDVADFFRKRSE